MNRAIIDTDILSYFLRGGNEHISSRFSEYLLHHNRLIISRITEFEILAGLNYKDAIRQIETFNKFKNQCIILNISAKSIKRSAEIYGQLRKNGILIGTPDLLIAGIALENNLTLITNNVKHYEPINDLELENWNTPKI